VVAEPSDSNTIPPLEESLKSLASFLEAAPDDDAIAWLKESARHTLESQQHTTDQPLRVALLGEFSSGKTRLINALLGEKILSTGIVPVTRSVTRIVHGDEISVTVRHVDGTEMEVGVDQLKAYTDERRKEEGASEVDEVILRHPSPLLKKVELWDTPGFNSDNQLHDQVAAQLLLEADAVLWILSPHQVGTRSEGKLLETVRRAQGKVVAVLNQTDRLDDDKAITKQVAEVKKHYARTVEEVVPTSAKWLEEGHAGGNREQLMSHIEAIGAWSQEQRKRRTARRVAAVAAKCEAYMNLCQQEEKAIKLLLSERKSESEEQCQTALSEWDETKKHISKIVTTELKSFSKEFYNAESLEAAYEVAFDPEISEEFFYALSESLWALEETHWFMCSQWSKDFCLTVSRLTRSLESVDRKSDFVRIETKKEPNVIHEFRSQLFGNMQSRFPMRITGQQRARNLLTRIEAINACIGKEEVARWVKGAEEWFSSLKMIRQRSKEPDDITSRLKLVEQAGDSIYSTPIASLGHDMGKLISLAPSIGALKDLQGKFPSDLEAHRRRTQKIIENSEYKNSAGLEKRFRNSLRDVERELRTKKLLKNDNPEPVYFAFKVFAISTILLLPTGGFSAIGYLYFLALIVGGIANAFYSIYQAMFLVPSKNKYQRLIQSHSMRASKYNKALSEYQQLKDLDSFRRSETEYKELLSKLKVRVEEWKLTGTEEGEFPKQCTGSAQNKSPQHGLDSLSGNESATSNTTKNQQEIQASNTPRAEWGWKRKQEDSSTSEVFAHRLASPADRVIEDSFPEVFVPEAAVTEAIAALDKVLSINNYNDIDGDAGSYLIIKADDQRNYYAQFTEDDLQIYCEVVSNEFLEAPYKLDDAACAELLRRGWKLEAGGNYYKTWTWSTNTAAVVWECLLVLASVYGVHFRTPLDLEIWKKNIE
jgi:predicted GTPase